MTQPTDLDLRRRHMVGAAMTLPWLVACGGGGDASATGQPAAGLGPPATAPAPAAAPTPAPAPASVPTPPPPPPPPPTGVSHTGYPQFLTHDTVGSGPTRSLWNVALALRWRRGHLGDWLDALQVENGTAPYMTVPVPSTGRYALDVTSLVRRWHSSGGVRGFYLRTFGTEHPFDWAGRAAADASTRPTLVVVTSTGTLRLAARANATWYTSTDASFNTSEQFQTSGQAPAIVHFGLDTVTGTIQSATLELNCVGWRRSGSLSVFEADPPRFVIPDDVAAPELGIAAEVFDWSALANHPDVLYSADFKAGTFTNSFKPAAPRVFNPDTGTTYAAGTVAAGTRTSADAKISIVRATTDGLPDHVFDELYVQYWVYLEDDFGSEVDAVKSPAFESRMGWWNPAAGGYWQSTTGNGGAPGDGRKVWNVVARRWEYQGNSVRTHWGKVPADQTDYIGLFSLDYYRYHIDQKGPFPGGGLWEGILIRKARWYCFELHMKMNSITGPYDSVGNGEAVHDGRLRAWVNGVPAYDEQGLRWRRHPEMGVQGAWLNVFHGGTHNSPRDMGYRLDRVSISTRYIGPPRSN